jgi:type IV fimbrial biogenesis protein FimT
VKSRSQSEKLNEIDSPFVGHNIPFVGHSGPGVVPSVGQNRPFVTFCRKQRGFTLVELAIAVLILGILGGWAVPAIKNLFMNNSMVSATNSLVADITYARSEAIKRNSAVTICPSTDQANCSGTSDWSTGWIIFWDSNKNQVVDGGDKVVRLGDKVGTSIAGSTKSSSGIAITAYERDTTTQSTIGLTFLPEGLLNPDTLSTYANYLHLCDTRAKSYGRTLEISPTGHPEFQKGC